MSHYGKQSKTLNSSLLQMSQHREPVKIILLPKQSDQGPGTLLFVLLKKKLFVNVKGSMIDYKKIVYGDILSHDHTVNMITCFCLQLIQSSKIFFDYFG